MKRRILIAVTTMLLSLAFLTACGSKKASSEVENFHNELLGENVYIFSPEDDPAEVNDVIRKIYNGQETNQFGDKRYALCFLPGEYPEVHVDLGFYTQVLGLGYLPVDSKLGELSCQARWLGGSDNNNATCNFWRGVENLEVDSNVTFAVSQATDMRRMMIDGSLHLHDNYGWASGGFLSDSYVTGMVDSGSQQQWLSRNNAYASWMDENWNIVLLGDEPEGLPVGGWPSKQYTVIDETPCVQEKPFLVFDEEEGYGVFLPAMRENAVSVSWKEGEAPEGEFIPLSEFYVAHPGDAVADINASLAEGKHLLFTPGIYEVDEPIQVINENTLVLGLGLATLKSVDGATIMETSNAQGLTLAGLLLDSGIEESDNLLVVGQSSLDYEGMTSSADGKAICMSDMFFRVGGTPSTAPCKTKCCLTIEASNVIGDNFWVWRADHGDYVGWNMNTAPNGIIVNGDDVTIYALMVEHFNEYQTIWNGERGCVYMYQSEVPYDVPGQAYFMPDEETFGYASFYVAPQVSEFEAAGLGIYLYNRDTMIRMHSAMVVPDAPGVSVTNIISVVLNGYPGIEYVINDAGSSVINIGDTAKVMSYTNGEWK